MSLDHYRGMLAQRTRVEAFRRHIAAVVRPGDRVLEIGSGLGTFAFFAAQAGAGKVWAVEGGPIVHVARAVARHNDLDDRVEFLRGWFPAVTAPEPVDVLIFEDFNPRLIDQATWNLLRAVHADGLLKPGARVVPDHARIMVAPVMSERNWRIVGPAGPGDAAYGIDWSPSRPYICNSPLVLPLDAQDLQHEPVAIADVRFGRPVPSQALAGHAEWTFERATTIHGLAYWFDLELEPGTWLTNRPGGDPGSWGYLFLPIEEALRIEPGETLTASVAPEVGEDGAPTWLTWELIAPRARARGHEFLATPATRDDLVRASPAWVPTLHRQAVVEGRFLALADGTRSIAQIAEAVVAEGLLPTVPEAVTLALSVLDGKTERDAS